MAVCRVCSLEKDFTCHTEEMKSWFLNKGYPKWLINQEKWEVNYSNSIVSRRIKTKFKEVFLWLFTTHYLKNLVKLPTNKYSNENDLLKWKKKWKNFFTPDPMNFFRSARKLSRYLVRTKLYPLKKIIRLFQMQKIPSWSLLLTKSLKLTIDFLPMISALYLLTCEKCKNLYVGKIVDHFWLRRNNRNDNWRKFIRK